MNETADASASRVPLSVRLGNFFFRYRNGLFPVLFVVLAVTVPPARLGGDPRLDLAGVTAGVLLALAGEVVRCATIGLVYIKRGGKKRRIYAADLVTEGIYAHTRNPMYLGNLLIAAGACLAYGSPWVILGAFPFFLLVYLSITRAEEHYLRGRFGPGYEAYCRDVNRFWPRLRGLGRTLAQHRFDWKRVVNKEYGTLFQLSSGLYVLLLYKYYRLYAPSPVPERPGLLAVPFLAFLAFFGVARWMKKTGRV
ncbi:isoprenylcysteine carboxylmethyltransferase family protein [Dissulfurirhabdus thermomarina]|uniref:Isoprenylcysteine carboxylmethyltransferase family protein n=1 Tax=Dissulfurirhabdus thermomarina TaxID=1765737 RepID=A0A6N9TMQ7_DISTH|nr:isoprenylcysteine carboxylmethyltransferase family protein [Dissulfurirhabdus thermomarina]NDY42419.1 isoprenylcysteine carboxylmethyltransferase family protein [Dissulfurirhabdus thermomarina]NMX23545.1 isoprenylcysteine carboxylmethyltransferase family protein [Dissulfurirhabdus thermomarina]